MKNLNFKLIPVICLSALLSIGLTSCYDDDDFSEPGDPGDPNIGDENKPEGSVKLDCHITGNTVLSIVEDADIDYYVDCIANIDADLTIEEGVVIAFASGAALHIRAEGSLNAVGTSDDLIVFTATTKTKGHWRGLLFDSNNPDNVLDYVRVEYAGQRRFSSWTGAAVYGVSGQLSVTNSELSNSEEFGIHLTDNVSLTDFAANTFSNNGVSSLSIGPNHIGSLDHETAYNVDNEEEFIRVYNDHLTVSQSWPGLEDAYYLMEGYFDVLAELTIEAGAEFRFRSEGGIEVKDGFMSVEGEEANEVVFRGRVQTPGYWRGITFMTNNPDNKLNYAVLSDGGDPRYSSWVGANVSLRSGLLNVTNSTFKGSENNGLYVRSEGTLQSFENNTFAENSEFGLYISTTHISQLDSESKYNENNSRPFINVVSEHVNEQGTWPATDAPFLMRGYTSINAAVNVDAGAMFRFNENSHLYIDSDGSFNAVGTAGNEISFTGVITGDNAPNNQWGGLVFNSNNPSNLLDYVEVAHAGTARYSSWTDANVRLNSGILTVTNSVLRDVSGWGLYVSGGTLTQNNNSFIACIEGNVGP